MARALRKDSRPARNIAKPVESDDALDDVTVGQILDATSDALPASPESDPVVGIRNALIGGVLFWAAVAAAYFVLAQI
jgi:hypothetical protein